MIGALLVWAAVAAPQAAAVRDQVRAYRRAHEAAIVRELADLVALPNLAADAAAIRANAEAVAALCRKRGLATRLLEGEGPPAVLCEARAPGAARTVAFYAHYDGQPVDPSQWSGAPWTPVLRDNALEAGGREIALDEVRRGDGIDERRLYARSTSDDKAPIVGMLAALDALAAAKIPLSVNLKLFFEGEEEASSPHLGATFARHAQELKADIWVLCDGPVHPSRRMQVFFGARGVTGVDLTVYGPLRPLHSGHYGNWVPNPALVLAHLLAGLRDLDGRIRIAGFYDDVRPPTASERRALAEVPASEEPLKASLGLAETLGDSLAAGVLLPALNIRGIQAGGVGEGATNSIPAVARASLDFRLVPDQTPESVRKKLEAHLRAEGFHLVAADPDLETRRAHARIAKLQWDPGYPPARVSMDQPLARAVARRIEEGLGTPIVQMPTLGGSVPMYLFGEVLATPVLGVPIANHDNNQHAANENLRLQNLWDGIEVYAALFARLGVHAAE